MKFRNFFILTNLLFLSFFIFSTKVESATLLSDDFTGTTIDTLKWIEVDTGGSGGTTGNITQNGSLNTANGYVSSTWGTNVLTSLDNFDSDSLEISTVMTNNSDQLLGYGDYNFQSAGTKAYILDMVSTSIYTLVWNNGSLTGSNFSCGTFTDGATYKMKILASSFEVYKNDVLQCTQSTTGTSIDDEKVFLQSATTASVFDDVLVIGNSSAPTAPGAPTSLSGVSGNTQVSLSWTAPVSNGGSAITDYLVEYKLNSEPTTWTTFADGTSTSTSATVTGLTNDLLYNFRVSAINTIGTSTASGTANATPSAPTAPGAPTSLSGVSGNTQVSLSWTAPVSNGGSAITDYLVEYKLNSEPTTWTTFADGTSTSTSATVTGLTNDLLYDFRVSAINAIGTSTASGTANATPGQAIPLTISNLALWLDGSDTATITESSGIISQVTDKSGNDKNATATGSVRPTLVSSVQNGRSVMRFDGGDDYLNINSSIAYRTVFVVAKYDATTFSTYAGIVGDFTGTSPSNGHIVNGVDATNKIASATNNYASAYRNGTLIAGSTGHSFAPLNEFWIGSFELSSGITNTTSAIGMINGGGRYWDGDIAEIIAYSTTLTNTQRAQIESYLSTKWGIAVIGPTAPDAPTSLGASKGDTQIALSWTAPANNGDSEITDYVVEYKLSSEPTTWTTFADGTSTSTSATVTGLTNDLSYDFRVKAVNLFGTSSASSTATKTPGAPTAPDAPTIGIATNGNGEASVSFTPPVDNGGASITSYTVTSSPGGFTATGSSSPIIVTGLTNGIEYTFTITATNAIGTSSASSSSNAVTPSLLGNQLIDSFTGTTIDTLKWFEFDPTGKGGVAGKITQNGTLAIADSYISGWGTNALISQDSFSASDLEISAVMNTASNPLIGYGDYNFGISETKAYLLYAQHSSTVLALSWDGLSNTSTSCGTATSGATYKMKIISGGFEVYKNDVLQCTHNTAIVVNNKPVFLEVSAASSTFDNILVYGTKTTAIAPGQVTGLSATGMNKQVLLNWDAPTSNGYAVISDYLIEYKLSSADSWSTFSDGTSQNTKAVVTGIINDSAYDFRVSAINSFGSGVASSTVSATPGDISNLAFVITGESNSGGIGLNSSATSGEIASRSSVQILELTSGNFLFENLDIGTNNLRDHAGLEGYYSCCHGLELGLANSTEAHAFPDNEQVYLIKTGHGGSQVSQWNYAGTYFTKFLQRTAAAKTQIDSDRKWVVWMSIGINDGIAGTNINSFKTNLTTYINNIKADLPGAIIIMTQFQSMPANSGYPAINAALADVASEEANVYVVDTTTATGTDGANHWTYAGLKTVASLMTTTTKSALGLNYPGLPTSLGATPSSTSVALSWTAPVSNGGSAITDYVIEYKLNSEPTTWTTFADGISTSTSASVTGLSESTVYNFRIKAVNANGSGNYTSVNGTTTDGTAPVISSISATPTNTTATITYTTNELGSSIIDYGLTNAYGTSTVEADTSPRVTSHSVELSGLVACTTYNYRVKSKDATLNLATGSNNTFTTTGCTGSATVVEETQESIPTATGGTKSLLSSGKGIALDIPAGSTDTDAIFQIKSLDQTEVFLASGTPSGVTKVGNYAFDLKALTGVGTSVTSFLEPIELTFTYDDADVVGITESSLVVYRWDGATWNALTDCVVDTTLNTITCTTTNFSVFSIFGSVPAVTSSSSTAGAVSVAFLQQLSDNLRTKTVQAEILCKVGQSYNPTTGTPCTKFETTTAKPTFTKDLKLGTIHPEVKLLQQYLNNNGYVIAKTGPGSKGKETTKFGPATRSALIRFQKAKKLPSTGFFGVRSREVVERN